MLRFYFEPDTLSGDRNESLEKKKKKSPSFIKFTLQWRNVDQRQAKMKSIAVP